MNEHWHSNIDSIVIYGVSAVVFINFTRIAASWLAKTNGPLAVIGKSLGGLVQFG